MIEGINISDYDYVLPDERIAKFPPTRRGESKLLLYKGGSVSHTSFCSLADHLPKESMLVFNNTKVIHARLIFHKSTGARIEVFCLEPCDPADYERAFAVKGRCRWRCIVGNLKKWKGENLHIKCQLNDCELDLEACLVARGENSQEVEFQWNVDKSFGELLEELGRIPIPPYLNRESEEVDTERYQTVYSKFEGSVAAPTAGLHFTQEMISSLGQGGVEIGEVTLHVGAGTFLPVKSDDATEHIMHAEHFEIDIQMLRNLCSKIGEVTAVGTTSVRTLESLSALGYRIIIKGTPECDRVVGQWELYDIPENLTAKELLGAIIKYMEEANLDRLKAATQIMIAPGYKFRVVSRIITNFHQPKSTLLLLVSAFIGDNWHRVYDYALANDFRFLSYGDSSLLIP